MLRSVDVGIRGVGDGLIFVNNRFRLKAEVAPRCSRLALPATPKSMKAGRGVLKFCSCYSPGTGDGEPKGFD